MSVYVDNARLPFGRMKMSHMVADTSDELHEMALRIGLRREWCQNVGTHREHYDVSIERRRAAVALGALEVDSRKIARICRGKRDAEGRT